MSERYEIQEKIGQGGIGAVYRAYDTQLKRSVAIKRMLPSEQEANGPSSVEMMLKEATTLSALQHPNIITVYDVGIDDDGPFVVMELLKGETLDLVIQRGVLTMRDFGEVVSQTMEALIAAEAAGVLHRDLKPTNVMVNWLPSKKFQVKILDFSLAKFSRTPAPQTIDQGDAIFGSIYFMAPEQFERGNLDKRTDLYSMGCLYYFCLSGQYPFQGDSAAQVMASHLQGTVVPLEQIRSDLPPVICQWVMWLINRYADDRPQDSKEAFENYQNLTAAIDPSTNRVPLSGQHSATPLNSNSRRLIVPPPRHTTSVNRLPTGTVSAETGAIEEGLEDSVATGAVTVMPRKETNLLTYLAIGLAVLVIVAAGLFAMFLVQKRSQDNAVKLLESFQSSDAPLGSAEDVPGLAGFLDGGVSDGIALTARTALTELKDVTGSPTAINVAVVKELEKARNPYVQVNLIKVIQERKISSAAAESLLLEMTSSDQDPAVMREVMTALA
ncbi:MAG: serine/threonine protein kinase, partial [Verrucomicrobiales bacterium]